MWLFLCVVLAAIAFEYINGFHDAANAIATVSTKVLTPRQVIALAAFFNLTARSPARQSRPPMARDWSSRARLWAWVFTLPATGLIGYVCARIARGL